MNYIRLKTSILDNCIQDRLQYNPEIVEFHLETQDVFHPDLLIEKIKQVQNAGATVYLHHPMKINDKFLDILSTDQEVIDFYWFSSKVLSDICKETNTKCVVHAHYARTESSNLSGIESSIKMRDRIQEIVEIAGDRFLWEDTIDGLFSYANPYLISHIIAPLNLHINVDVSHTFIAVNGDNKKLEQVLESTKPFVKYFHIVDSMGVSHDSLPIGEGKIDWEMVKPYVENSPFVFEIGLKPPFSNCKPMVESAEFFSSI